MKTYLIDGNNLIGKIEELFYLQKKDKQASREKLVQIINIFFASKKERVLLFFDGFANTPLLLTKGRIYYSESQTADQLIKNYIENSAKRKNLVVVSSDNELKNFGKVCSCEIITSEEFGKLLTARKSVDVEKKRIEEINNVDEWIKIFNKKKSN